MFYPNVFQSIFSFHCFVAEHMDWFKSVMKFCMDDFNESTVATFEGKTLKDLVQLAAVGGVVPLHRVDILCEVTKNDNNIDWRLIRAMAIIDSIEGHSAEERVTLVNLYDTFLKSEVDGIISLFHEAPYHFIKYFLFELFSGERKSREEIIEKTLAILSAKNDLHALLDKNEGLRCGIAFLLRKALSILFQREQPEKGALFDSLSSFISAGAPHFVLASHCAFDVIFEDDILTHLDMEFVKKFEADTRLFHFVRMVLVVSILIDMSGSSDEIAMTFHELIIQLLQGKKEDIREMTLFVLRQLSSGGTVDIEKAVAAARSNKHPEIISKCSVIDEVSKALQRVSPLACFTDFTSAVAALSEYSVAKTNNNLNRYKALNVGGRIACIGSYCLSVAPQPIAKFMSDIYPVAIGELPHHATNIFQRVTNNQQLLNKSEKLRELVLSIIVAILNDNKAVVFYKQMVEDILAEKAQLHQHRTEIENMMVPKCPRQNCRRAFFDFNGCFAVTCTCGCGFCGHCLMDCGTDAHAHVAARHGGYFGTQEQFRREFGAIAVANIRNYMQTVPARIKPLLEAEIPRIIANNNFFVRPEQITQANTNTGAGNRGRDVPPIIGTFLEILSCGGYIWNQISVDNSEAEPLDKLLTELEHHMESVHRLLFPDAASDGSAFSWVHAMIWKLRNLGGAVDRKAVQDRVLQIYREFPDPLGLLGEFDQKCRSHLSCILSELQVTEKQLMQKPFDEACSRALLTLPRSIFNFKHQFWAHLKANYETYPVLNLLGEKKSSLTTQTITCTLEIIRFLHRLQQAASERKVTRAAAAVEGSFYSFIKEYGEPLTSSVKQFEKNFITAICKVTDWQCNHSIHNTYEHMLNGIPDVTKLECFLPQLKGVGILSMALWSGNNGTKEDAWVGLPVAQNCLFDIIHGREAPKVAGSPYFLADKNIVSVDFMTIFRLVNELFVVPGYQPYLSEDLNIAEELCKYGAPRLASFPYIATELPEYNYGLEGISDLFTQVGRRIDREPNRSFTTLPATLASAVKALIHCVPHAADLIYSFCEAILVQQSGDNVTLGKEVWEIKIENQMPLTEEQQQGRQTLFELPTAIKSFHIDHLPAMMGLCWNSQNLHETANVPIEDEDEIDGIVANFQKIVDNPKYHCQIPVILASLRATGVCHFSTEISNEFGNTAIVFYLTIVSIPLIEDDDVLIEEPPFTTLAKHFGHVLHEAERILGPHELSTPVLDNACVVPFSAVRQFLQSHIVEETNSRNVTTRTTTTATINTTTTAPQPVRPVPQQPLRAAQISVSSLTELEL